MLRLFYVFMVCLPLLAHAQYRSQVWSPDNGDGTYTNPVINADYSDPDVCVGASGEDYYLTAIQFFILPTNTDASVLNVLSRGRCRRGGRG